MLYMSNCDKKDLKTASKGSLFVKLSGECLLGTLKILGKFLSLSLVNRVRRRTYPTEEKRVGMNVTKCETKRRGPGLV